LPGQNDLAAEPVLLRGLTKSENILEFSIVRTWDAACRAPTQTCRRKNVKGICMPSNAHLESIGVIVEIAGVASAVAGVVLSLHHWPAAAALIGGGVAYIIGKKLRAM
jgi:hypothetical protein